MPFQTAVPWPFLCLSSHPLPSWHHLHQTPSLRPFRADVVLRQIQDVQGGVLFQCRGHSLAGDKPFEKHDDEDSAQTHTHTHTRAHTHTHTLIQIALRAVSVLRHAVTWTSVWSSYEPTMMKGRKVPMVSTNNNRRLHLKMQARGVKHDHTLYVLRQQRKGKGVTMVSTNNNKKSFWKQVRRSDQLRYPIHNRSFVAHGRLWMPCAPAAKTCFEHLHASVKSLVFSNVAILNL